VLLPSLIPGFCLSVINRSFWYRQAVDRLSLGPGQIATAGTVRAFRLLGVPVRLHFTFILLLLFLVVTALGYESSGVFALFLLGLFASVLLHEAAHAAVSSGFGV